MLNSQEQQTHLLCFWIWKNLYDMMRRGRSWFMVPIYYNQFPTGKRAYFYDFLCLIFLTRCENSCHKCLSPVSSLLPHVMLFCYYYSIPVRSLRMSWHPPKRNIMYNTYFGVKLSTRPVFMIRWHRWLHTRLPSRGLQNEVWPRWWRTLPAKV